MADDRIRTAERAWRETGAIEDHARYLLERVRLGDLARAEQAVRAALAPADESARDALFQRLHGSVLRAVERELLSPELIG